MAEIDDLKMILKNADVSCITDAKTDAEQKLRFVECRIFVNSLERREAEIRAKAISEFAEQIKALAYSKRYNEWGKDTMISIWESVIDGIAEELKKNLNETQTELKWK